MNIHSFQLLLAHPGKDDAKFVKSLARHIGLVIFAGFVFVACILLLEFIFYIWLTSNNFKKFNKKVKFTLHKINIFSSSKYTLRGNLHLMLCATLFLVIFGLVSLVHF